MAIRWALCVLLWIIPALAALASPVRVLALASDPAACEKMAAAVRPYGLELAVVVATPENLSHLATDGSDLLSQYAAAFIENGVLLPPEFCALLTDAVDQGMGLLFEGGPQAFQNDEMLRHLPVMPAATGAWHVLGTPAKMVVKDPTSPLLWRLGWAGAPKLAGVSFVKAKVGAREHLAAGNLPLLLDWDAGGRVLVFAGRLSSPEPVWQAWKSFNAFRARLLQSAAGVSEAIVKGIAPLGK